MEHIPAEEKLSGARFSKEALQAQPCGGTQEPGSAEALIPPGAKQGS